MLPTGSVGMSSRAHQVGSDHWFRGRRFIVRPRRLGFLVAQDDGQKRAVHIQPAAVEQHLVKAASDADRFSNTDLALEIARFLGQQAEHHSPAHISLRTLRLGYELATINNDRWRNLLLKALPRVVADPKELT